MQSREEYVIIPKPQKFVVSDDKFVIGEVGVNTCRIQICGGSAALLNETAAIISDKICALTAVRTEICCENNQLYSGFFSIHIKVDSNDSFIEKKVNDGYYIKIFSDHALLCGYDAAGAFYAANTFAQLLKVVDGKMTVPDVVIQDWPDLKYRGLFLEDRYGTDHMTLEDWKSAIDYMASIKMNSLTVGIYGCWCIQYDDRISEYLYVPINKYPQLKTPRNIKFYSVKGQRWICQTDVLPDMFEHDYFNELLAYGKSKNVNVKPLFNSMGHNTLLPRMFPQISAKDEQGNDTGFGFCTSTDETYEVMFNIYDEIINKYLKPSGIDWFEIGLDEVRFELNIDANDRHKEFSPWCQCSKCSSKSQRELMLNHVLRLAKHLKSRGINSIMVYHDMLQEKGLINDELVKRLKEEGLYENIVIDWWDYGGEDSVFRNGKPTNILRGMIKPFAGYYHWTIPVGYLHNIAACAKIAAEVGLEGMEAYSSYDLSYDRNYSCIAEFSWNIKEAANPDGFIQRHAERMFPYDSGKAAVAFEYLNKFMEAYFDSGERKDHMQTYDWINEKADLMLSGLSYYFYTYLKKDAPFPRNFPGEAFKRVLDDKEKNVRLLAEVRDLSSKALAIFEELDGTMQYEQEIVAYYKLICSQYKVLSNEFLSMIEMVEGCDWSVDSIIQLRKQISVLQIDREKLIREVENTKPFSLQILLLRNMSIHRQQFVDLQLYLDSVISKLKNGENIDVPVVNLMDTRHIESKIFKFLR